jgi:hypothetical protein
MNGTDARDQGGFTQRLSNLVDNDVLEHPTTRAIARLVVESGLSTLAPDQRDIYELYIKPHLGSGESDEDPESILT